MQAQQMVNILRRVRHDFANHLQVISGYLDLGCPDKAQAYIGTLSYDLEAEGICFAIPEGGASIYYYV